MVVHRVLVVLAILPLMLAGCQTRPTPYAGPPSVPLPGERGRVHVANGTVVTDEGTLLRGASMMIMKQPGYANDPSYWRAVHDLGLNAVRVDVKTVQIGKTVEEQLPYLDRAIDLASQNGMYIMFKTSVKPGGYDLDALMDFWRVAAPRYRNRTNVLYELTNEPVSGSPVWGAANQWTDKVIGDLTQVYDLMRAAAPQTHIVLFTTPNLYPDCASWKKVVAKMQGVDWTKASVGFHHYGGTVKFGEANIECLRQSYPLVMTETNYWLDDGPSRANTPTTLRLYERLGISWFSLDGKGSFDHLQNEILPDLHAQGYNWRTEP